MNSNDWRPIAAAALSAITILGCQVPAANGPTAEAPTAKPVAVVATTDPTLPPGTLARGNFKSHGGQIDLDATQEGKNVSGTMTYTDLGGAALGGFMVDLDCARTTDGGLVMIGGPIIDSTNGYVETTPEGTNIALILQPGSRVKAEILVEHPDPHEPSCPAFLEKIPDLGDPERPSNALEPIDGTIDLRT